MAGIISVMLLSEQETKLIETIRKAKDQHPVEEVVFLLRYVPIDYEGSFVQQVLPGTPQTVFQISTSMRTLLTDLENLNIDRAFFSITKEPYGLRLFTH